MLGGPGGAPKEIKMQCLFQNPPRRGPEARLWPKGAQKGRTLEPKGSPKWSKKRQKGIPKPHPHSDGTLWVPIGGPGTILDGFGVDLEGIFGRFLMDFRSIFRGFWSTFSIFVRRFSCCVVGCFAGLLYLFICFFIRHHALRHFPVPYVSTGIT